MKPKTDWGLVMPLVIVGVLSFLLFLVIFGTIEYQIYQSGYSAGTLTCKTQTI